MREIMDYLYNGMLYPTERVLSRDPDYVISKSRHEKMMNHLKDRLSTEDYKLVEEMCDCGLIIQDKQGFEFFCRGLSLGIALMHEGQECLEDFAYKKLQEIKIPEMGDVEKNKN